MRAGLRAVISVLSVSSMLPGWAHRPGSQARPCRAPEYEALTLGVNGGALVKLLAPMGIAPVGVSVGVKWPFKPDFELESWSGRRASNPLPRPWQGRALPSELLPLGQRRNHNPARVGAKPRAAGTFSPNSNISSMRRLNVRAIVNASGKLGSYLPVSIAFTVWRETPSRSA